MYSYMQLVADFPLSTMWMLQIWNTAAETYALSYFSKVPCLIPDPKPDILSFWSFLLFLYTTFGMDSSHPT